MDTIITPAPSTNGVLGQLCALEAEARRSGKSPLGEPTRLEKLRVTVKALTAKRDRLRAEVRGNTEEDENTAKDSESCQLMDRKKQLQYLLHAHHLIGGYDIVKTRDGKGLSVSLATAYHGVYLDTYNLEIDLKPVLRITRHNIPPSIALSRLAEQSNMQADIRGFLGTLSQHLNAFAGRQQQLKLVKELHESVNVMESNALCSLLVLMFTVPKTNTAILCKLEYTNHRRWLPTRVHLDCDDEELSDSPPWKRNCSLLMDTPVHKALEEMKKAGDIV